MTLTGGVKAPTIMRPSMPRYVVVPPANETELAAAFELLAKSFLPDYHTAKKNLEFVRANEPYGGPENHLIVKGPTERVVGAFRFVNRTLMYGPARLKAAGMSYIAVDPEFRDQGIGLAIPRAFVEKADQHFDVTFGNARKAIDGYWTPFGYIGYTSFSNMTVAVGDLPKDDGECRMVPFSDGDLAACQAHYLDNYQQVYGSVFRDDALWAYCLKRIERQSLGTLYSFHSRESHIVGYALLRKNTVLEVAGKREASMGIVKALAGHSRSTVSTVEFNLSPSHPFFRFLLSFNHSFNIRRVWNGGHVARTGPVPKFLDSVRSVLEMRMRETECPAFFMRINEQAFDWSGSDLALRAANGNEPETVEFRPREWQKVLLGVVSPSDVIGFTASSKRAERNANSLFPVLWPQISEVDEP